MIDPRHTAVLIRPSEDAPFDDRTADIAHYSRESTRVRITFTDGKSFPYRPHKVLVLDRSERIPLDTEERITVDGTVWDVAEAWYFTGPAGAWWHLFTDTRKTWYCRAGERVAVIRNAADLDSAGILNYWRTLAEQLPAEGRSLRDSYRALTFVHPDSVLRYYLTAAPPTPIEQVPSPRIYPFRTNISQRIAIDNGLHHRISVIDGPPGTGKTQSILNLIANLLVDDSCTIAVVSSNNAAVDNVYDKLVDAGFGYVAANLGKAQKKEEFFARQMQRNSLVEALCAEPPDDLPDTGELTELDERLRRLQNIECRRAELRGDLNSYLVERRHFADYFDRRRLPPPEQLPVLRWKPQKILDFIADTDPELAGTGALGRVVDRITHFFKYRSMRGVDTQDIDLVLRLHRLYYDKQITEIERQIHDLTQSLQQADFSGLLERQREMSIRWLREHLRRRYEGRPIRTYDRRSIRHPGFTRDYPVILSTCHSLESSIGPGRMVDYLVIDEASQVDLLAAGTALARCRNVVVVGDLRQLPHIPDVREPGPAPGPAYDYREHSILSSIIELYGEHLPRRILREHYRCDPQIIGFCNRKFYDDQLIPFTRSTQDSAPMVVVRTEPGNHMRRYTGGGRSNQREVDVIRNEILPQFCISFDQNEVGVTTPYRKQVGKVTDALIEAIEADTVHRFQGREKDAVVMTTVLDETWRGWTGLKHTDDPQLVNVAVSRAKKLFVLVTNHDLLPKSRHLRDLIGYIGYQNPDGTVVDSTIVSVFDLLYRDHSERLRPLAARIRKKSKYPSEDIMRTVLQDLLQEPDYRGLSFHEQMYVGELLPDTSLLTSEQARYVKHRASVDFVVFNRVTKDTVCVIEVDGFQFHENNPRQLARDALKDEIFASYGIPLIRLPTTGSAEIDRIRRTFDALLDGTGAIRARP
ncbi:AAA domain-containing protein [Nocardia carnea]|uniref:AAA domain-containing protein n=1 Tax=Nocardia carnea TaxID=37328 RepID=UPI0024573574|nr:AAA domain-containing protein [Nocardia carnea]